MDELARMYDKDFWEKYGWISCFECDIIFTDLEKLFEHQMIHLKEEEKNICVNQYKIRKIDYTKYFFI